MDEKLEISIFRHKTYKDVFLTRNWCVCGASSDTYKTTTDVFAAIGSANLRSNASKSARPNKFDYYFRENIVVKHTMEKEMEFDGYSGVLTKEIELKLTDFEEVILTES